MKLERKKRWKVQISVNSDDWDRMRSHSITQSGSLSPNQSLQHVKLQVKWSKDKTIFICNWVALDNIEFLWSGLPTNLVTLPEILACNQLAQLSTISSPTNMPANHHKGEKNQTLISSYQVLCSGLMFWPVESGCPIYHANYKCGVTAMVVVINKWRTLVWLHHLGMGQLMWQNLKKPNSFRLTIILAQGCGLSLMVIRV